MWNVLVTSVGIPLLTVLVMTVMESLARPTLFWEKMADVGWDLCILGVGVTGGIFTNPAMQRFYGVTGALLTAIIVLLVNLGFGAVILHLKKRNNPATRVVGTVCVVIGSLAVGLPSGLTFVR